MPINADLCTVLGRYILPLLVAGIFPSCNNPSDPGKLCTNIDVATQIKVVNAKGENLLNQTTSGYYAPGDIRLYYLKDGVKSEVYNPSLTYPRNFLIIDNGNGDNLIEVFLNEGSTNNEITTTLLQWRNGDVDTLNALITREKNGIGCTSVICSQIYCNGKLKYDIKTYQPVTSGNSIFDRFITISK